MVLSRIKLALVCLMPVTAAVSAFEPVVLERIDHAINGAITEKKLPGGVFHEIMLDKLARLTGLSTDRLSRVAKLDQEPALQRPVKPAKQQKNTPVRHLITLLLQQPELAQHVDSPDSIADIELPGAQLLMDLLVFLQDQPGSHTGTILEHWRDSEYGKHLAKLALVSLDFEDHRLEAEFKDTLKQLEPYRHNSREQILAKMARGETPTPEEKAIIQQTSNPLENQENL